MSRIAVAMSGGVDSSVTAALLKQQGHEVIGITMHLFEPHCSGSGSAVHDAAAVAQHLDIPHHVADFAPDFSRQIIGDFIEEYRAGHTPNPCVRCNRYIKFGMLLEKARELGADLLATGHYVRKTVDPDGTCHLRVAGNAGKDQSYFLYTLTQHQLRQVIFPLGEIESKDEVRTLAREFALPVAEKSDSQEVCFIPNDDYVTFLEGSEAFCATDGDIVHLSGQTVGRHHGTHRYTIGQRKGLGIAWSEPLYVTAIDAERNVVVVGEQQHVYAAGLRAKEVSWVVAPEAENFAATCKIRYRHQPVSCQVLLLAGNSCEVRFDQKQKAITPGQSLVFYRGDEVLGGGIITGSSAS
ncbi:MAG: tRNA 2-thiouridine(34) synthase MnmA [Geobacteraceae bacterium]|nr:tRNA 2-thiouridine(34) synthase MnmA [Geobacteraceae bacterium]NTW81213.1 tRNA 2-thiouridine(34) synthase MnmA [Geobacteraceae bacterium]